jgi:hypothetical protein
VPLGPVRRRVKSRPRRGDFRANFTHLRVDMDRPAKLKVGREKRLLLPPYRVGVGGIGSAGTGGAGGGGPGSGVGLGFGTMAIGELLANRTLIEAFQGPGSSRLTLGKRLRRKGPALQGPGFGEETTRG